MDDGSAPQFDALLPPAMARRAEEIGVVKASAPALRLFALAILAGAFIALGSVFSTVVTAGGGVPFGVSRVIGGLAFSLGLVLVVVGGAELFTGNNLIVMAWASRRVTTLQVLRNWAIVYAGNFVGAVSVAILVFWSGQYRAGDGAVATRVLAIGDEKTGLPFGRAVVLGVLANALVCLAVWLSFSARSVVDRVVAVTLPVTAFVASGFEHSIANMYLVPEAILVRRRAPGSFLASIDTSRAAHPDLRWDRFLVHNLVPVTLGNVIGGALLVGLVYWFVYLRRPVAARPPGER
jgi:formate transporter FocA